MKKCSHCGQVKSIEDFHRNRAKKDGLAQECKVCCKQRERRYYLANKHKWQLPRVKEKRQQRYRANIEREKEKSREWAKAKIQRMREEAGQKECSCCYETKLVTYFACHVSRGLEDTCKACKMRLRSERKREAIAQRPVPAEKSCSVCGVVKPLGEFYKHAGCKFGVNVMCKPCSNKQAVEYAHRNPERKLERDRAFRAKNPEKRRIYEGRYKERFPDKVKAKKRAGHIRRKCRLKEVGGDGYTGTDILELMMVQGGKCKVCETDISTAYHVDHIIPISRGGVNEKDNIQLLCPTCNMSKGNKTMEEFLRHKNYRRRVCLQENTKTLTR